MKLILSKLAIFTLCLTAAVAAAHAEPSMKAAKAPVQAKATNPAWGSTFVEEAFSAVRMATPFANAAVTDGAPANVTASTNAKTILDYAAGFLGTRYRLGASGPKAFDCSGFTSYVFRHAAGVDLTRSSRSQFTQGTKVDRKDLRPGDLLFFSSRSSGRNNVGHVGIVSEVNPETGKCTFIHASTKRGVTYTDLSEDYYSRRFIGAKRVIE